MLATCSPAAVEAYLKRIVPARLSPRTVLGREALSAAVEQARADGYAQTVDQAAEGVTGTAAVVRDAAGGSWALS
ncbi:IclR family transcriptional regulator C-terminal domain-containing protein [Novosphingobium panipatense]